MNFVEFWPNFKSLMISFSSELIPNLQGSGAGEWEGGGGGGSSVSYKHMFCILSVHQRAEINYTIYK